MSDGNTFSRDDVRSTLVELFAKYSQNKSVEVTNASKLIGDLGFDSLAVMEVVSELEDRYAITFDEIEDLPTVHAVGDVLALVEKHLIIAGRLR